MKTEICVKIKLFLTKVDTNIIMRMYTELFPQFGGLTEIQMENGTRTGHYDGQCDSTVRT